MDRRGACEAPPLLEELLRDGGFWGRKSQFFLMVQPLVGQPHSSQCPTLMSIWTIHIGLGRLKEEEEGEESRCGNGRG